MMKARQVISDLDEQKLLRATYSERQLQEVLADFWFNHFNIFAGKGADRQLLTAYERDTIRRARRDAARSLRTSRATTENPADRSE